jgi:hypothetical protein
MCVLHVLFIETAAMLVSCTIRHIIDMKPAKDHPLHALICLNDFREGEL